MASRRLSSVAIYDMSADSSYPVPFDASTFIFPAEWHAFSDLLGGADTGLLFLRGDVILHLNNKLAEQLGYAEEDIVGKPVESIFPGGNGMNTPPQVGQERITLIGRDGSPHHFQLLANRLDTLTDAHCTIWVLRPEILRPETQAVEAEASTRLQAITEHLPDLVVVCNADSTITYANKSFDELAGRRGDALLELVHPEDRPKLSDALRRATSHAGDTPLAFRLQHRSGSWRYIHGEARDMRGHAEIGGLLLNARDVTEQIMEQQSIAADKKRQLHYFNRLLHLAQHPHPNFASALKVILKSSAKALGAQRCAYWEVTDDPATTRCVMAYDDVRQNLVEEASDTTFATAFHPLLLQVLRSKHQMTITDVDQDPRAAMHCEYFHGHAIKATLLMPVRAGERLSGILVIAQLHAPRQWRRDESEFADNVANLIQIVFREVERGRAESGLRHVAHYDSLTGLPNRDFLFDQAADIFPKLAATSPTLATFFIDIDGFKHVNDALGHHIGDELLKAAAMRLRNLVRKDDILVRLGGDEFMLLARNLSDPRIANDIATQIVETMRNTFSLQGRELQISASVGIALYPFDGADIDTLMKKADMAMYQAKASGRDRYRMFTPRLDDESARRNTLESELQRAIDEHELRHYYHPQVDLRTGKVSCVEALMRWEHPERGILLPEQFLHMAEESDLLHQISTWVFDDVCTQLRAWSTRGIGEFNVSINMSAGQLMDAALLTALEGALDRSGLTGRRLEWEVKEDAVMQHCPMTSAMLHRAADMHVRLSIDDFGTGYSNMAYLRRYPVHKVKIDRSLISGLPGERDSCAITDAIISMARPLGVDVVAEGVETPQQMSYLREHGCNIAQGYLFTQPLTAEQFETWLTRR